MSLAGWSAGVFMAEKLFADGYKVVAVSDSRGGSHHKADQ
jgi:glutamate dehydrogenase/leucine dehydrogenase